MLVDVRAARLAGHATENPAMSVSTFTVGTVLGTFSKGATGAVSINFGLSGGANCATSCRHHPIHYSGSGDNAGKCYAVVVESRADRVQLRDKLARHETLPASTIVGRALVELSRLKIHGKTLPPWVRISANGAVPAPAAALADRRFLPLLRELLAFCRTNGIPVHFPVETAEKAAFYTAHVGDIVTIRESIQTHNMMPCTIADHARPAGAASFTAGEDVGRGSHKRKRILAAAVAAAAAWSKRTGRKTIVCPAVRVSFLSRYKNGKTREENAAWRDSAKCGNCTACAQSHIDIVYPAH
jgi:hypothetical protein